MKSSKKLDNLKSEDLSTFITLHNGYAGHQTQASVILADIDELEKTLKDLMEKVQAMNNLENELYKRIADEHGMPVDKVKEAIATILLQMKQS